MKKTEETKPLNALCDLELHPDPKNGQWWEDDTFE